MYMVEDYNVIIITLDNVMINKVVKHFSKKLRMEQFLINVRIACSMKKQDELAHIGRLWLMIIRTKSDVDVKLTV